MRELVEGEQPPIARIVRGQGRPLNEDLLATATRAENLAAPFGAAPEARAVALWSDLGKAKPAFQAHVKAPSIGERVNHSSLGAWYARRSIPGEMGTAVALAIVGHHGGLPNQNELLGICNEGAADSQWLCDVAAEILQFRPPPRKFENAAERFLFTQLICSAHIDADRTEAHAWSAQVCGEQLREPLYTDLTKIRDRLFAGSFDTQHGELGRLRNSFFATCKRVAAEPPGLYQITAPSSIIDARSLAAYVIEHTIQHGLRRIIFVCATQAALEQRAEALREVLSGVLVIPAAFDYRNLGTRAAVEDWDAPVILTTLRDFLNLLFDNRAASLRRLHRIACATILIENAWRIPAPIAPAVRDTLRSLVTHFKSTVAFVSALPLIIDEQAKEIGMPQTFERIAPRVRTTWPQLNATALTPEQITQQLATCRDCLVIWNDARSLRTFAGALKSGAWTYLSSGMCPKDRREILRAIREQKRLGRPVRLATDRLGEALDVTFETVWREMADLPSVAIAASRADAGESCAAAYNVFPSVRFNTDARTTQTMLINGPLQLASSATWRAYTDELVFKRGRSTWTEELQRDREHMRFRDVANKASRLGGVTPVEQRLALGEACLAPVVVPAMSGRSALDVPVTKVIIDRLDADGISKPLLRQLMDYVIWVDVETRRAWLQDRHARWVADAVVCLTNPQMYDGLGLKEE